MSAPESPIVIDLNPRERRLYDRLRSQLVRPKSLGRSGVPDLLFVLPDLTILLFRLMREPRVMPVDKLVAGLGVAYVLSPLDFLPGLLLGPVGLVDDLVVVGTVLSRLINHVHPDVVRSHWSGQGDALEVIQRVTAWIETAFSNRMRAVVRWLTRRADAPGER